MDVYEEKSRFAFDDQQNDRAEGKRTAREICEV